MKTFLGFFYSSSNSLYSDSYLFLFCARCRCLGSRGWVLPFSVWLESAVSVCYRRDDVMSPWLSKSVLVIAIFNFYIWKIYLICQRCLLTVSLFQFFRMAPTRRGESSNPDAPPPPSMAEVLMAIEQTGCEMSVCSSSWCSKGPGGTRTAPLSPSSCGPNLPLSLKLKSRLTRMIGFGL